MKSRLLLVENDRCTAESLSGAFRALPLEVRRARDSVEALGAIRHSPFQLLVLDSNLPEVNDLEFVRVVHSEGQNPPFIIFGDSVTIPLAVEAMRLGAIDVLGTPFSLDQLRHAVCRVLWPRLPTDVVQMPRAADSTDGVTTQARTVAAVPHRLAIADRLAIHIVNMIDCKEDLKTTGDWSKHVRASSSALREYCRLADVKPSKARDLGRVLRGVCRSGPVWLPETVLDCSDTRTLKKLMEAAGLAAQRGLPTPSALEVLRQQRWIAQGHAVTLAIRNLLRHMSFPSHRHRPEGLKPMPPRQRLHRVARPVN